MVTLVTVAPFAMLHILDRFHWLRASTVSVLRNSRGDGAGGGDHRHAVQPPIQPNGVRPDPGLKGSGRRGFSQYLEPEEGGPLQPAYEDFNKMSKELQSIQTLRSDFINHFSHEFKTPITAIKGFAELLREPDTTPEEREQYLQIILDESSHLADLANSTLLLTRLESQQFIAEKRPYPWTNRSSGAPSSSPPLLGEKADLLYRQPGAGGVRRQRGADAPCVDQPAR